MTVLFGLPLQIRDVLDMRKEWIPLMVSSKIAADLPALPAQFRMTPEDFTLLPALRGAEDGWEFVGAKAAGAGRPFAPGNLH